MERVSAQCGYIHRSKYLTCNFNDFELGRFMLIQRGKGHGANRKPMGGFKIFFRIGATVRINSTSGLADGNISDLHPNNIGNHIFWDSTWWQVW